MYKHILVTLDGTSEGEAVMPHALDVARAMEATLTLLRVVEPPHAEWSERGALGKAQAESIATARLADQAEAYLEKIVSEARRMGVDAHTLVRQGPAARQIVAVARELDADAIAMSTHSRRGLNRLMFGSVAEAVLHETSIPVVLVRSRK